LSHKCTRSSVTNIDAFNHHSQFLFCLVPPSLPPRHPFLPIKQSHISSLITIHRNLRFSAFPIVPHTSRSLPVDLKTRKTYLPAGVPVPSLFSLKKTHYTPNFTVLYHQTTKLHSLHFVASVSFCVFGMAKMETLIMGRVHIFPKQRSGIKLWGFDRQKLAFLYVCVFVFCRIP